MTFSSKRRLQCVIFIASMLLPARLACAQPAPIKLQDLAVGSYTFPLPGKLKSRIDQAEGPIRRQQWSSETGGEPIGPLPGSIGVVVTRNTLSKELWSQVENWKASDFYSFTEQSKQRGNLKELGRPLWKDETERAKWEKVWKELGDPDKTFGKDFWMVYDVIVNSGGNDLLDNQALPYGSARGGSKAYRAVDAYILSAKDRSLIQIRMFGGDCEHLPPVYLLRSLASAKVAPGP